MKLLSVVLVPMVLLAGSFAAKPSYAADALIVSICNFVAADDKNRLRKKLRSSKVKLRNIYDGVRCDGKTLLQFSMAKNAANVGVFIVKRLPVRTLVKGGELGWANDNGYGDSEITKAIKERIED